MKSEPLDMMAAVDTSCGRSHRLALNQPNTLPAPPLAGAALAMPAPSHAASLTTTKMSPSTRTGSGSTRSTAPAAA